MKILASRPVGVVGLLLLAAGCGSNGPVAEQGQVDASVDATAPTPDGQVTPPADDATPGEDVAAPTPDGSTSCGDGTVNGTEQCDDGASNGKAGDPCTSGCAFVCVQGDPKLGDAACDDGNPCNGAETCLATHACASGTPLKNGVSCGAGEICDNQVCGPAVCGDGIVTTPEECDDGSANGTAVDGCTKKCAFVCVSTDSTRNCTPADSCAGQGTCNDATHTCTGGTAPPNGTVCGGGLDGGVPDGGDAGAIEVCKAGVCGPGYCGDGVRESGEDCDLGAGNGPGTGCELNCTFSCKKSPDSCVTTDLCAGTNACTSQSNGGQKCVVGAPPATGTVCGGGDGGAGTCQGGVCKTTLCGDGIVETADGEKCDFGAANNLAGSGCEPDCQFSCQTSPDSCPNDNVCGASPTTCQTNKGPNNGTGQKCQAATAVAACGDCASSGVCVTGKCATSICGDGCVDSRIGETCEPPNTAKCDANCHTIAAAVCGNGKRETGEQCDDNNKTNLDGCDSNCQFEQEQRATQVTINGAVDTFCTHNALGNKALQNNLLTITVLNSDLATGVGNGSTTIAFKFMNITDLTGQNVNPGLALGALAGTPVTGTGYSGTADTDWWYTTTAGTIDATRTPTSLLPATLSGTKLAASGTIDLAVALTGPVTILHTTGTKIAAQVGAATAPKVSTGATPGHLASENLDPALTSFGTMTNGQLCGNLSAASLANVPVPTALVGTFCTPNYAATNSLLDVLVGGCTGLVTIATTQPDQVDPAVPAAGAGAPYTLTQTGTKVTGCKDKSGTAVDLTACETAAAYSSYFGFTSDRVILK